MALRLESRTANPPTPDSTAPTPPGVGTKVSNEFASVKNTTKAKPISNPNAPTTSNILAISAAQPISPHTVTMGIRWKLPMVP